MNSIKKVLAHSIGWLLIVYVAYLAVSGVLYLISGVMLNAGYISNSWPVGDMQRAWYFSQRNIWQSNRECATPDNKLIYVPTIGGCEFNNYEFSTQTNFDSLGRVVPNRNDSLIGSSGGLAVLGDSHAMGWGVNDAATFSNQLQLLVDRPVYNLGVSSYGTERELRRLAQFKYLDSLEYIVIQYCENDLGENKAVLDKTLIDKKFTEFSALQNEYSYKPLPFLSFVSFKKSLKVLHRPPLFEKGLDFENHFSVLLNTLNRHRGLLSGKKVIIFYSNSDGKPFDGFSRDVIGFDEFEVSLIDLDLKDQHYFKLDDHLNPDGHSYIAKRLNDIIKKSGS